MALSQGFSTLHDIDAFRCIVEEISDYLAGNKRLIVLIISALRRQSVMAMNNAGFLFL